MKRLEPGLIQGIGDCHSHRCADIAEQHVGAAHLVDRPLPSRGYRLFNEALLEADAQVARNDFDEVTRYRRRGTTQQALDLKQLLRRSPRRCQPFKTVCRIGEGERVLGLVSGKQLRGHVAEVAVTAVHFAADFVGSAKQAFERLPDQRSAGV